MTLLAEMDRIGERRAEIHEHHPSSRLLSEGCESIGVKGEFAFGAFCGVMPDISDRPEGDGGVDFFVPLHFSVDVKTARKAYHLLHEQGKAFADIYVLAEYDDATDKVELLGWTWGSTLARAPVKDFGYGKMNHYIAREALQPMRALKSRMAIYESGRKRGRA